MVLLGRPHRATGHRRALILINAWGPAPGERDRSLDEDGQDHEHAERETRVRQHLLEFMIAHIVLHARDCGVLRPFVYFAFSSMRRTGRCMSAGFGR